MISHINFNNLFNNLGVRKADPVPALAVEWYCNLGGDRVRLPDLEVLDLNELIQDLLPAIALSQHLEVFSLIASGLLHVATTLQQHTQPGMQRGRGVTENDYSTWRCFQSNTHLEPPARGNTIHEITRRIDKLKFIEHPTDSCH